MGQAGPLVSVFATARIAAFRIFQVIDSESVVDTSGDSGTSLRAVKGTIEFRNVSFAYPTRPNVLVLNNFNLTINAGTWLCVHGKRSAHAVR